MEKEDIREEANEMRPYATTPAIRTMPPGQE
jgi:hypothetical protein